MAHLPNLAAAAYPYPLGMPDNGLRCSAEDRGNKLLCYQSMKAKDSLYFNSLFDRHITNYLRKPVVKKHLHKMSLTAADGTVNLSREEQIEANHLNRFLKEREDIISKLNMREQSHLHQMRKAARYGEVMFTKDGVFETENTSQCEGYHTNHQVAPLFNALKPRPRSCSHMGKEQVQKQDKKAKRLLNQRPSQIGESVSVQTSHVETDHIQTQTSRKDGSNVTTQTSMRRLPNQSTQTSQRTLPEVSVQTSLVCRPVETISKESSSASSCVSRYFSEESWCGQSSGPTLSGVVSSTSCEDCKETLRGYINQLMVENEELDEYLTLQMVSLEENALYEAFTKEQCSYNENMQIAANLSVKETRLGVVEHTTLDKCKSVCSDELKRNTALKAILTALANGQDRMNSSIEKQKAAQRVKDEQRKMDELIAEQVKLRMKKKLEKELKEKCQMLVAANTELADIVQAQKRAEPALRVAEKQQAPDDSLQQHTVPDRPFHLLRRSISSRKVTLKSSTPVLIPVSPTERDFGHVIGLLEQIKRDMSQMFPQIGALLQERISSYYSPQRICSKKSQVEKLPSVTHSNPVKIVATREVSKEVVKCSTLSTVSLVWKSAVEKAEAESTPHTLQAIKAAAPQAKLPILETASQKVPVETASQSILVSRPSSTECHSIRINESVSSPFTPLESQTCKRPSSIECRSSEALRIDEGRVPECTILCEYVDEGNNSSNPSYRDTINQQDEICCPPSDSRLIAESKCLFSSPKEYKQRKTNDTASSYGCLSDQWSQLNSEEVSQQVKPQPSMQRVPTPPAYPRPAGCPVRAVIPCHSSQRQISASSELMSPLAIDTWGMVPYQSQRTQLGLNKLSEQLTPSRRQSREELAEKEGQLRESLSNLPPKRTIEEFYTAEAEVNPMSCSLSPASVHSDSEPAELQEEENEHMCAENITSYNTDKRHEIAAHVPTENMAKIEVTCDIAESELNSPPQVSTENANCIPITETKTSFQYDKGNKDDKPLCDEYSATCLQESSSTYMFSAGSATLPKINSAVARLRAKAASASEPITPVATPAQPGADCKPAQPKTDVSISESATTEEAIVPQVSSTVSTRSSKKGSRASLKKKAVVTEETVVAQVSSSVSTKKGSRKESAVDAQEVAIPQSSKSSRKGSSASLKEPAVDAQETAVPQVSSNRSSREGSRASLKKEAIATEVTAVQQVSSNLSTKSSRKGSRASLKKEAVAANEETAITQVSSNVSTKSSRKGSLTEDVATGETTTPQVSGNVSTRSSRKGSLDSLKTEAEETTFPQVSSNASTRSSRKGSRASLKEAVAAEESTVPQVNSTTSTSNRSRSSLKEAATTENEVCVSKQSSKASLKSSKMGSQVLIAAVPQSASKASVRSSGKGSSAWVKKVSLPMVATKDVSEMTKGVSNALKLERVDTRPSNEKESEVAVLKKSTMSIAPSDESYTESLSPKGTKMSYDGTTCEAVITATGSKKSLTSVKSPILLPSLVNPAKELVPKKSTASITPSEVSVEHYMETQLN